MAGKETNEPNRRWLITILSVALLLLATGAFVAFEATLRNKPPVAPSPTTALAISTTTSAPPSPTAVQATLQPPIIVISTPTPEPAFVPVMMKAYAALPCDDTVPTTRDELASTQWQPLTLNFHGPQAEANDANVNPFLDYRLQVIFLGPSGQINTVPGYFAGDGRGGNQGNIWRAQFAADEPGRWRYCATLHTGPEIAVELEAAAGTPLFIDAASGEFQVAPRDPDAPGFFALGRLEYAGEHYLKFRDGPYWLKGGTNSPENFLGYAGFANTIDQGGAIADFLHTYQPHVADSRPNDPIFDVHGTDGDDEVGAAGIIGALNYLGEQHVNSIYFLPMNLGGDGQETYPYLSPDDNTRFDIGKLDQWGVVLDHAQRQGIALHIVLNEVEEANRYWLDGGALGVERRLFYREMAARFAHLPAIKWNLSEEVAFNPDELRAFATYLGAHDWANHPITIHNPAGLADPIYSGILGDENFSATSMQFAAEEAGDLAETWRALSAESGRPWVIDMDENNPAGVGLTPDNAGVLRKSILYDAYFSGAAGIEWYLGYHDLPVGGDLNLEDFRTRERMWTYMWYARRFMENNLPFPIMSPADELLTGETELFGGGEVLALAGEIYALYLPAATPEGTLAVPSGSYRLRWYDPRTGEFVGEPVTTMATEGRLSLGPPPSLPDSDWVVLVTREGRPITSPTAAPYP